MIGRLALAGIVVALAGCGTLKPATDKPLTLRGDYSAIGQCVAERIDATGVGFVDYREYSAAQRVEINHSTGLTGPTHPGSKTVIWQTGPDEVMATVAVSNMAPRSWDREAIARLRDCQA